MSSITQQQQPLQIRSHRGFTLVEVLVSLALFAIVVSVSVSSLIVLIDANNRAQESREIMNQVSGVLDAMSREIRTGFDYQCGPSGVTVSTNNVTPRDCSSSSGSTLFAFTESGGSLTEGESSNRIGYRYSAAQNAVERNVGNSGWQRITPDGVTITGLDFYVTNTDRTGDGDTDSPVVTIILSGETTDLNGAVRDYTLQTTVTQRLLDL